MTPQSRRRFLGAAAALSALPMAEAANGEQAAGTAPRDAELVREGHPPESDWQGEVVVEEITEEGRAHVGLGPLRGDLGGPLRGSPAGQLTVAYDAQSITIDVELPVAEDGRVTARADLQPDTARQLAGAIRVGEEAGESLQKTEVSAHGFASVEVAGVFASVSDHRHPATVIVESDPDTAALKIQVSDDRLDIKPALYTDYPEGTDTGERLAVALKRAAAEFKALGATDA